MTKRKSKSKYIFTLENVDVMNINTKAIKTTTMNTNSARYKKNLDNIFLTSCKHFFHNLYFLFISSEMDT